MTSHDEVQEHVAADRAEHSSTECPAPHPEPLPVEARHPKNAAVSRHLAMSLALAAGHLRRHAKETTT